MCFVLAGGDGRPIFSLSVYILNVNYCFCASKCSKYDLYSKSKVRIDVEEVKPYYLSLIEKVSILGIMKLNYYLLTFITCIVG